MSNKQIDDCGVPLSALIKRQASLCNRFFGGEGYDHGELAFLTEFTPTVTTESAPESSRTSLAIRYEPRSINDRSSRSCTVHRMFYEQ